MRPVCSQCIKSKRPCHGYRNVDAVVFRNETTTTKLRVDQIKSGETTIDNSYPNVKFDGVSQVSQGLSINERLPKESNRPCSPNSVGISIQQSQEQLALSYFFTEYVLVPRRSNASYGYLEYLPPLYMHANLDSALSYATSAVALTALCAKPGRGKLRLEAQRQYGKAILRIQEAISNPIEVKSDLTLLSVLLFGLFESMTCTIETLPTWGKHIDGAVALIRFRGEELFESPVSRALFYTVRFQMLITHISRREPVKPFLNVVGDWATVPQQLTGNAPDKLTAMSLRLPAIRASAVKVFKLKGNEQNRQKILDLMENAQSMDQEATTGSPEVSEMWRYTVCAHYHDIIGSPEKAELYPGRIDEYYDIWEASLWNGYRTCRIFTQEIILNCLDWLMSNSQCEIEVERCEAVQVIQRMVDGICASVPFHLGVHGSEEEHMGLTILEDRLTKQNLFGRSRNGSRNVEALGGYLLIWPLFVARNAASIPEIQRRWINGRLSWIGREHGLNQATVLSDLPIEGYQN